MDDICPTYNKILHYGHGAGKQKWKQVFMWTKTQAVYPHERIPMVNKAADKMEAL